MIVSSNITEVKAVEVRTSCECKPMPRCSNVPGAWFPAGTYVSSLYLWLKKTFPLTIVTGMVKNIKIRIIISESWMYRPLHKLCEVLVAFDFFLIPPKVRFRVDRNLVHC